MSHTGVGLKAKMGTEGYKIDRIQLSLFDSPEKAPLECANNDLCEILPAFEPNRDTRFVANYISYYDKCLSDCEGLEWVVDATILAYRNYCQSRSSVVDCISCKHEAGVFWYSRATDDATSGTAYWWTPMANLRLSESIVQYHVKKASEQVKIEPSEYCRADEIVDCE